MTTILDQVLEATTIPRQQGSRLAAEALKSVGGGPHWVAAQMHRARAPVGQLARTGHRLNDRAHKIVGQMLDRNAAALEAMMDIGATRMQTAAEMLANYAATLQPTVHRKARRAPARTATRRTGRTGRTARKA